MTVSTAPAHIRGRYLRGGCFVLAMELHRKTGLPLYGLTAGAGDDAPIEHAFVADPDRDIGIDIRGEMPLDRIAEGAQNPDLVISPVSAHRIMAQVFSFDPADEREARRVIRDHLHDLPRQARRTIGQPPPTQDQDPSPM